jgi:hypothetical protein
VPEQGAHVLCHETFAVLPPRDGACFPYLLALGPRSLAHRVQVEVTEALKTMFALILVLL